MLIFRTTPVNLTISGCRCARNGATGSWWVLLKTQFLVYSPWRRLRTGWSKDINNLLPPPHAVLSFYNFSWSLCGDGALENAD